VVLAAPGVEVGTEVGAVHIGAAATDGGPDIGRARRVTTFSDLGPGELGLLDDSSSHLSLVLHQGSAARCTGLAPGSEVTLVW
jgi:S-adenosylmethionine hydrolase